MAVCHLCGETLITLALHYLACPVLQADAQIDKELTLFTNGEEAGGEMLYKHNISSKQEGADTISGETFKVNVYTSSGEFVACLPVIPFVRPPEVITWGERSFALTEYVTSPERATNAHYDRFGNKNIDTAYQYREVLNYIIPLYWSKDVEPEGWACPYPPPPLPVTQEALDDIAPGGGVGWAEAAGLTEGEACPECGEVATTVAKGLHICLPGNC